MLRNSVVFVKINLDFIAITFLVDKIITKYSRTAYNGSFISLGICYYGLVWLFLFQDKKWAFLLPKMNCSTPKWAWQAKFWGKMSYFSFLYKDVIIFYFKSLYMNDSRSSTWEVRISWVRWVCFKEHDDCALICVYINIHVSAGEHIGY